MELRGNIYGVKINDDFLPCEIDCEITITTDMIEKSGSHGGRFKHFRPGYINWNISANARTVIGLLNSSSNSLLEYQINGIEIEVYISARQSNVQEFDIGGIVLISSQQLSFGNSGFSNHSITMQGVGELGLTYDEIQAIINAQPYYDEKNIIVNTTKW